MSSRPEDLLQFTQETALPGGTLVLGFSGWMDGGDVSTGTVERLVELLAAHEIAQIDSEPFYIYNFPGSMEITALFRPHIKIQDGLIESLEMPSNSFYCHPDGNLALFLGKEPNMHWRLFADAIFAFAKATGIHRVLFVGSFGGSVPHTRQPRLYVTCSHPDVLEEMQNYGVQRTGYEGPGSFTSYLLTRAPEVGLEMTLLVAEIPGYLQGTNPASIEAVTRRLSQILKLPLDLDSLRSASTQWELQISSAVEQDEEFAEKIRELERDYDDELIEEQGE